MKPRIFKFVFIVMKSISILVIANHPHFLIRFVSFDSNCCTKQSLIVWFFYNLQVILVMLEYRRERSFD